MTQDGMPTYAELSAEVRMLRERLAQVVLTGIRPEVA